MSIHLHARRAGIAAPEKAVPESKRAAVQTLPSQVRNETSADRNSRPSGHEDATRIARPLDPAPWNDIEIARFLKRVGLLERRGLSFSDAEALAERLVHRDRERDDRRCCVECDSLQQSSTCFRGLPISRTQLIRCVGFRWQQP